ncbi:MAG: 2-C-methyl-D-erythritol 4-phosphate cytidylyltransferase [Chloroflexia bacterium]
MFYGEAVWALVVAAGRSRRMGGQDKLFAPLAGVPLLARTVERLLASPQVDEAVVVLRPERMEDGRQLAQERSWRRVRFCTGGPRRQDSVRLGLETMEGEGWVLIHDGARPFVTSALVERGLEAAAARGAAVPGLPLPDTVKRISPAGLVEETLPREALWSIQTPQTFRLSLIRQAHRHFASSPQTFTDDAALLEALGHPVAVFPGEADNFKVTSVEDLRRAEALWRLQEQPEEEGGRLRIGLGYDIHRLRAGRRLVLGGVEVPFSRGLVGHSDADVLTHAVMDALLGAAGLGDIGTHFPPEDPAWKDASSLSLLERVVARLSEAGWAPRQVSAVLVAERPRLGPFVPMMRSRLAERLGLSPQEVAIQVTTNEGLGALGRGEGLAAWAVVQIGRLLSAEVRT